MDSVIATSSGVISDPVDTSPKNVPLQEFTSTTSIATYIKEQAILNGVSPDLALYVASHESGFDPMSTGDEDITCSKGMNIGKPVHAKGVWQITSCYHPEVTDEQAMSVVFSTQWAMVFLKYKNLCIVQFSTCADYYKEIQ